MKNGKFNFFVLLIFDEFIFLLQGYTITEDKESAQVWLLNSCTVKNPAEEHFKNEVNKGLGANKKVVVAGCVPQVRFS